MAREFLHAEGVAIKGILFKRSSRCGPAEMNLSRNAEVSSSIPVLAQWVKNLALPWAVGRSQTQLGSCVVVAMA